MADAVHGVVKPRKMADAEHLVARNRLQVEMNSPKESQGAFRTHEQPREVGPIQGQFVNVVATDAAQQIGKSAPDFSGFAVAEVKQILHEFRRHVAVARINRAEMGLDAAGEQGFDRALRCAPCCHSGSSARRNCCCRSCRRWWRDWRLTHRPDRTARCGLRKRLSCSSTMPGCTQTVRAAASKSMTSFRWRVQSRISASPMA